MSSLTSASVSHLIRLKVQAFHPVVIVVDLEFELIAHFVVTFAIDSLPV